MGRHCRLTLTDGALFTEADGRTPREEKTFSLAISGKAVNSDNPYKRDTERGYSFVNKWGVIDESLESLLLT